MTLKELIASSDAVAWLSEQAALAHDQGDSPEGRDAMAMALHLQIARSYLIEYCVHLHRGASDSEAVVRTASGHLKLDAAAVAAHRQQFH